MPEKKKDDQSEQRKSMMQFNVTPLISGIKPNFYNGSFFLGDEFTKDDVRHWLTYPQQYEKLLRRLSQTLYIKSQHYKRLIEYFAKMAIFAYTIELCKVPDNTKLVENQFFRIAERIENMNLSHELIKVFIVAFREDVFYGYEHETANSYTIQQFNPDLCRLSGIDDGVFTFEFDLSYFDAYPDSLSKYPDEIQKAYKNYSLQKSNKDQYRWYAVNPDKSVCFKVNEDILYPVPPFAGVFDAIFDLQEFKESRKVQDELGINKFLVQNIPIRKDSPNNNDFMIDSPTVQQFHNAVDSALPDTINLITSPMDISAIEFRADNNIDNVYKAERDFFGASGVSQHLFNSEKSSSVGLNKSIQTDEMIVFAMLRQVERWLNRKIKRLFPRNYFRIRVLDVTHFNRQDKFELALQSAQSSIPNIFEVGAILGKDPASLVNSAILENEIFNLHDKLKPLSTSHTQSSKGGRPQKNENDLSTEGINTRDGEKNINSQD